MTTAQDLRFGEVVEASLERLIGQCHRLYEAPPMGTLVRAGSRDASGRGGVVYAIVEGVATSALDPGRRVIARGVEATSEDQVYQEHPQLERLLRTDVTLLVVGHEQSGEVRQYLPPLPPRIHTFLHVCSAQEVRRFMSAFDFLTLLAHPNQPTGDDVMAAALRRAAEAFDAPRDFLLAGARTIAGLLASETARLNAILRRLPLT